MGEGRRVLLVEDDVGLSDAVGRHLRARGHDVRVAGSVPDARDILASGFAPAVVLLDVNLPGPSGWDLLRDDSLAGAGSPAVYIVSATPVAASRLREFGVAGILPKPFASSTLIDVVERDAGAVKADSGLLW